VNLKRNNVKQSDDLIAFGTLYVGILIGF